jgi:hypothetical protein
MSPDNGTPRTFYRVRRWNEDYENAQSRPLKYLRWLASPILLGTSDYAELLDHPNGLAHYGLWKSFTELAAQCQPRGSLLKEGGVPHTQKSIALTLRCSIEILQEAIGSFLHLSWLEEVPFTKQSILLSPEIHQTSKEPLQKSQDKIQTGTNNARAREHGMELQDNSPPPPSIEGGGRRPTKREQHALDFAEEQKRRLNLNA